MAGDNSKEAYNQYMEGQLNKHHAAQPEAPKPAADVAKEVAPNSTDAYTQYAEGALKMHGGPGAPSGQPITTGDNSDTAYLAYAEDQLKVKGTDLKIPGPPKPAKEEKPVAPNSASAYGGYMDNLLGKKS